ncbi:Nuclear transport factor 2 family protein with RNA binding domain, putative isoform 1 [Hibiscus syriacus]|uniref:Nuclear transport factor 2 family protein with RNA binding domain, putative isoform 1 n=1 Tax=Hibiscus syriacus TaxID=106335 RepID=A0A6A3CFR1_HIBSY|nr:Nuclear transport factor 2 family protein with RNA binding domain, putative isoform 1 [Hibiscus syriacus]
MLILLLVNKRLFLEDSPRSKLCTTSSAAMDEIPVEEEINKILQQLSEKQRMEEVPKINDERYHVEKANYAELASSIICSTGDKKRGRRGEVIVTGTTSFEAKTKAPLQRKKGNARKPELKISVRAARQWMAQDSGMNDENGYYSEHSNSRDERKRKTGSNVSTMYSSSTGSDIQSSSNQGGCSSETKERINCSVSSNLKGQSERSTTTHQSDSAQSINKSRKGIGKMPSLNTTLSTSSTPKIESDANNKSVSTNKTSTIISKDTKGNNKGKHPKPQTPTNGGDHSLRSMPCVSTTGNVPMVKR